jgi:pyruvate/2-oxoglutarate dehydrogenase complex dihydrolipoamide acyltransferase (E2) component
VNRLLLVLAATFTVAALLLSVPSGGDAGPAASSDALAASTPGASTFTPAASPTSTPATATPVATATPTATPTPPVAANTPAPSLVNHAGTSARPAATNADASRLRIPRIGVDARVVLMAVSDDGTMPAPSGPLEVASYTFAAHPGETGNVVLAGHVDFANYGAAVFYRLRELRAGDEFSVFLPDGSEFVYRVAWVEVF